LEEDFFAKMDIGRQANYAWQHGQRLVRIEKPHFDYDLYFLHYFFVEVVYNIELGQVERIEVLSNQERLVFYVNKVDLADLI